MSRLTIYNDTVDATVVSNRFIDEYMKDANDAQIKVYLYLMRMMSSNFPTSISEIADKFNHTEKDVVRALTYWEKHKLVHLDYDTQGEICALHMQPMDSKGSDAPSSQTPATTAESPAKEPITPAPVQKLTQPPKPDPASEEKSGPIKPFYNKDDISSFKKEKDSAQKLFVAQTYLGHPFSSTELQSFMFISRELRFSLELIDYLFDYCLTKGKKSMRYIEKVALSWSEQQVTTAEQAKKLSSRYRKEVYTTLKALGRNSDPTTQEADYVNRWLDEYGFGLTEILYACEKTVVATESHRLSYAESILASWKNQDLHHLAEIQQSEKEYTKSKAVKVSTPAAKKTNAFNDFDQRKYDYDALEKELLGN